MRKTAVLLALMAMSMSDVFAATGKVVTTNYVKGALESLDAAQVGADGSYIQYVSETDGIVSATAKAFDTALSSTSTNAVQNKVINTALGKKQNTLSTAQLNAVNSGITAAKLSELEAKQGALTDAQLNAVNSGITAAKVSTYDGYSTTISGAVSDAATAKSDAATAKSDAATAKSNAATALTTANTAKTTAEGAVTTANTAKTTADNAAGNASTALQTAQKASKDVETLTTTVGGHTTSITNLQTAVDGKQATLVPDTNIKGSGSVTVTKGTDGVITVSGTDNNTTYTAGTNITISNGVISAKDTVYTLPTASADTLGGVKVDTALSSTSTNPVQNKVVYSALSGKLSTTGTAAKATADASGNNIVNTYATKTALNEGLATKQDTLVPDTNIKGSGSVTVTKGTDGVITVSGTDTNTTYTAGTNVTITNGVISAKDTVYTLPEATSSKLGGVKVDTALSSTSTNPVQNQAVNTAISNLQTAVDGKQATLTTTNVTSTGAGNVVTAVTASNGTVTVTKGTTLGSLATKSAVGSSDITDGGVALADLASNSVNSAKIVDGSVATADIANGAVTAVKTTGIFGFIPSGSEGASTTATIWVE